MPLVPAASRVQQADVEAAWNRTWIFKRDIVHDVALREAPSMDDYPQLFNWHGLRPPARHEPDIIGIFQTAREPILCVMVAGDHDHANADLAQPPHAIDEEQGGSVIAPLTIENIPGDHNQAAVLLDRERHQVIERLAQSIIEAGRAILGLPGQTDEGAVEMQVGGVWETEIDHCLLAHLQPPTGG